MRLFHYYTHAGHVGCQKRQQLMHNDKHFSGEGLDMITVFRARRTIVITAFLAAALVFITPVYGFCLGLFDAGVHFTGSSPLGEFKDIVDQNGYGVSAVALFKLGLLPLKLGVEVGEYGFGEGTKKTALANGAINVESKTNNYTGMVVLRLQQGVSAFAPYVDGLLGVNVVKTETTVKGSGFAETLVPVSVDYSDTALSYGIGAGLMYRLARLIPVAGPAVFLDIKLRYLLGGKSEFHDVKSFTLEDSTLKFDKEKFNSDQLIYHVGVMVGF